MSLDPFLGTPRSAASSSPSPPSSPSTSSSSAAASSSPSPPSSADPSLIAHRGCAGQYPENTVTAVTAAAPHVDAVEVDVRPCGTGEPVVFHDETLDRLTDGSGPVDEVPLARLRELDVCGTDASIPSLAELLSAVSSLPIDLPVNVEVKTPAVAAASVDVRAEYGVDVIYSSFHDDALRELRRADPDAPLAVLCAQDPSAGLDAAAAFDALAIHPSMELALETDVVGRAHDRGLAANAWTASTAADAERLVDAGVDGIITDRWDVFDPKPEREG